MSDHPEDSSASLVRLLEGILAQLDGTSVTECEFRAGGHRILVRRSLSVLTAALADPIAEETQVPATWQPITAPLTGIFYITETPHSPPFVSVGSTVSLHQVVGLIESMKMYNPVESEIAGTVRAILAPSSGLVEKGQVLMYLEPLGDSP
jgi:acetyl-CoA carboxylase biotin carboxyl carrier protein